MQINKYFLMDKKCNIFCNNLCPQTTNEKLSETILNNPTIVHRNGQKD